MEIDLYFTPIEKIYFDKGSIGSISSIYTKTFPDWETADIVIFSTNENRDNLSSDSEDVKHQRIREFFYNYKISHNVKVADLGILNAGSTMRDTLMAIKEITNIIQKKQKLLVILGGSQYLTYANYLGYEDLEQTVNLTCIDRKFDVEVEKENDLNNNNYINHLLLHQPSILFNFSVLGFQQYYASEKEIRFFDDLYFDYFRLGDLQKNIEKAEPILRNTDILSVDLAAFRFSEFSSSNSPCPNGFFANEMCQLMKYAGVSDKLSCVGIYNQKTGKIRDVDSEVIAQMLYFLTDGFAGRTKDFPTGSKKDHYRYSIFLDELKHDLVFHKSPKSERWWLEVPYPPSKDFKFERHHLIPCDYNDYQIAQKGVIPDLWWKTYRKLN